MRTNSTILMEAADLILDNGWIQGSMEEPEGFCAAGAIHYVSQSDSEFKSAITALSKHLDMHSAFIFSWNDAYTQTKQNVVRSLIEASEQW